MNLNPQVKKFTPLIAFSILSFLLLVSFYNGKKLVKYTELEFNKQIQKNEAQATNYNLKEIDPNTGNIRWELKAREGRTEDNLNGALINDIVAELYKDKKVIFKLHAPHGKANSTNKQIYLLGGVTAEDPLGNFLLTCSRLDLTNGTTLEAKKGFKLVLKNKGEIFGKNAIINDDQTKITIKNLKEAKLKDIFLAGNNVEINRNKEGNIKEAIIKNGGKVILNKLNNNILSAGEIHWLENGEVEALSNVTYISKNSSLKANHLKMSTDGKIIAKDKVTIVHGSTICTGNTLTYTDKTNILISGNPQAVQDGKRISAEKIYYNTNDGTVEAVGNVKIKSLEKA